MKYFLKKLMGHEIFRSVVSWATKYFLKNLENLPAPPSYILNVRSLKHSKKRNSWLCERGLHDVTSFCHQYYCVKLC